jgi:hypothetical protein
MKKKITLIICSLLFAITGVKATEYTTVDELTSNYFVLTSVVDNMVKTFLWNGATQDAYVRDAAAIANGTAYYLFKAEAITVDTKKYYALRIYNNDKQSATGGIDGGNALNPYSSWRSWYFAGACEETGKAHRYGSDSDNNGLWEIEVRDGMFAFKSASSNTTLGGKYLNINGGVQVDAAYWTCYDENEFRSSTTPAEFTTVNELTENLFMLTAENDAKMLYFQDAGTYPNYNQDMKSGNPYDVVACQPALYYMAQPIVVDANTYYRIKVYNADGSDYTGGIDSGPYINLGMYGGIFCGAGVSAKYGTDYDKGALWEIAYVTDQGFTFRSVAQRDSKNWYMNDNSQSETAVYLKAYNRYSFAGFQRATTVDKYLTFCLPYDATVSGATVYQVVGVDSKTEPSELYIEEVADRNIAAGKAYILKATATTVTATKSATPNTVTSATHLNGLTGTLKPIKAPADNYVLSDGQWLRVVADEEPRINATRAYLDLANTPEGRPAGARYVLLNFEGGDETGITLQEISEDGENARMNDGKYFESGKIVIVKNGVKYSTNGQILK